MTFTVNSQPIEKRVASADGKLSVHSIFYTIQGEGPFCGTPAVFIRLAGCNLQCPGCDTDYTSTRRNMGAYEILFEVNDLIRSGEFRKGLVVITGGEPFRQDLTDLIGVLVLHQYYVQIESNGTLAPAPVLWNHNTAVRDGAYLVISPKTGKINDTSLAAACALKYVGEWDDLGEDGLPNHALRHTANPRLARPPAGWDRPIYLQPMDGKDEAGNQANLEACVAACMAKGYILQLQIHKIIGAE